MKKTIKYSFVVIAGLFILFIWNKNRFVPFEYVKRAESGNIYRELPNIKDSLRILHLLDNVSYKKNSEGIILVRNKFNKQVDYLSKITHLIEDPYFYDATRVHGEYIPFRYVERLDGLKTRYRHIDFKTDRIDLTFTNAPSGRKELLTSYYVLLENIIRGDVILRDDSIYIDRSYEIGLYHLQHYTLYCSDKEYLLEKGILEKVEFCLANDTIL